jgi:predicted  nucleic acid-binding Zn ribbon protein
LVDKYEAAIAAACAEKESLMEKHQGEMLEAAADHEAKVSKITSDFEAKVSLCTMLFFSSTFRFACFFSAVV